MEEMGEIFTKKYDSGEEILKNMWVYSTITRVAYPIPSGGLF
jgi:hypothetical protein